MLRLILFYLCSFSFIQAKEKIDPASVVVLYNSTMPESGKLAHYYAKKRSIPLANLVGLPLSKSGKISRIEYQQTLEHPLREIFTKNKWWIQDTSSVNPVTKSSKIKLLVTLYGVPFGANRVNANTADFFSPRLHSVSIDSELSLLGDQHLPKLMGPFKTSVFNRYFKQEGLFKHHQILGRLLVGRIDADSYETCKRMIDDALIVEKTGLQGMAYLDLAKKGGNAEIGDLWIKQIYQQCWLHNMPAFIDKKAATLSTNYPLNDTAIYFGWYAWNANGPFLHPNFKFKRGAVAVHIHSFSASNIRSKSAGWVGPLVNKGAAATLGNVYEPYLTGTHHLDIFHDRLRKGYTLVESAYMAMPLLGWQGVVLGDPLYQPFPEQVIAIDSVYTDIAHLLKTYAKSPTVLEKQLGKLAARKDSGIVYEALALYQLKNNRLNKARLSYIQAYLAYSSIANKTRCQLQLLELDLASKDLKSISERYKILQKLTAGHPEAKSFTVPKTSQKKK